MCVSASVHKVCVRVWYGIRVCVRARARVCVCFTSLSTIFSHIATVAACCMRRDNKEVGRKIIWEYFKNYIAGEKAK